MSSLAHTVPPSLTIIMSLHVVQHEVVGDAYRHARDKHKGLRYGAHEIITKEEVERNLEELKVMQRKYDRPRLPALERFKGGPHKEPEEGLAIITAYICQHVTPGAGAAESKRGGAAEQKDEGGGEADDDPPRRVYGSRDTARRLCKEDNCPVEVKAQQWSLEAHQPKLFEVSISVLHCLSTARAQHYTDVTPMHSSCLCIGERPSHYSTVSI